MVDTALAVFGLVAQTPVVAQAEVFYLWPENVSAWRLFMACVNRWRTGMAGREGLDAYGVEVEMRLHRVRPRQHRQRWREIKAMESAALKAWAEQQEATK